MLLNDHKYLFEIDGVFNPAMFQEFLKADDLKNNLFIGVIYDFLDYQEYR
jgi:hypothetical protein